MDLFAEVARHLAHALAQLRAEGALPADTPDVAIETETPRDLTHGDVASNLAMMLAKPARMKPRDIATLLAAKLEASGHFASVEVAGPGFLNMRLKPQAWHGVVRAVIEAGEAYGRPAKLQSNKVNVEYVSANPTGPMHVGHCRGAVFGDALANLLAATGYDVTREYYINDAGAQVDVLARSAYMRYREALGEDIGEIPAGLYPGDYLKPVGEALAADHGDALLGKPEDEWLATVRATAIVMMLESIKQDLAALDIRHDVFFSEGSLQAGSRDAVREAIDELTARGLIFQGRLEKPKGHDDDEWEDREQTLFRSTKFGDDVDRALIKSDGSYTYFAADIAYHWDKIKRGFDQLINIFGADHVGYLPRMKAAVSALGGDKVRFDILVCQLVKLYRAGEPVRMSKRAGTFVTLRDVVDEVGRDAVRFMMLYRKNDAPLDFDLAKVREQAKDNPVFYVQYGHARACSLLRQAAQEHPTLDLSSAALGAADLAALNDPGEIDIVRKLAEYPKMLAAASRAREPHRIAFYLYELASLLHQQYSRGYDSPHLRFIRADEPQLTVARLALV